jgi:hypothetical protein
MTDENQTPEPGTDSLPTEELSFVDYAKMFHEDTVRHNELLLRAAIGTSERMYSTLKRISEERYEQDVLLIRAVELLAHVVNHSTPTKHGLTEEFVETVKQYLEELK